MNIYIKRAARLLLGVVWLAGLLCGLTLQSWAQITVKLDDEEFSGSNLAECLKDASSVQTMQVLTGKFTVDDWATMHNEQENTLSSLTTLEFAKGVEVANIPNQELTEDNPNYYFNPTIESIHFMGETPSVIGDFAFGGCYMLQQVALPEGVTKIGIGAFCMCSTLKEIEIPEGVTEIEDWTFAECSALEKVTLPQGITTIEDKAFFNCQALQEITCTAKEPPSLGEDIFGAVPVEHCTLYVPTESLEAYRGADVWKEFKIKGLLAVTFLLHGADGESESIVPLTKEGKAIVLLAKEGKVENMPKEPTRKGYQFKGWNQSEDGSGEWFTHDTQVQESITVHAIWTKDGENPSAIESSLLAKVTVGPNPCYDHLVVREVEHAQAYAITNLMGQTLLSGSTHGAPIVRIDTRSLPAGVYILTLQATDGGTSLQLIKR